MLAQAWNLLAGYCGQISLGHAVFFGTGAYTSTLLLRQDWLGVWRARGSAWRLGALLAVAALAGHRLPGVPAARALLRHRHHRGGRDRADPHDQLGLRSAARAASSCRSSGPTRSSTSSSTRASRPTTTSRSALLVLALGITPADRALPHRLLLPRHPRGPGRGRRASGIPVAALQAAGDGDLGGPDRAGRDVLRPVHLLHRPRVGVSAVAARSSSAWWRCWAGWARCGARSSAPPSWSRSARARASSSAAPARRSTSSSTAR